MTINVTLQTNIQLFFFFLTHMSDIYITTPKIQTQDGDTDGLLSECRKNKQSVVLQKEVNKTLTGGLSSLYNSWG